MAQKNLVGAKPGEVKSREEWREQDKKGVQQNRTSAFKSFNDRIKKQKWKQKQKFLNEPNESQSFAHWHCEYEYHSRMAYLPLWCHPHIGCEHWSGSTEMN